MRDVKILTDKGVNVQKSLELFGTMEKYDSTLEAFNNTIGDKLIKLETFKSSSDMSQYAVLIHSIKSEVKYFGFDQLSDLSLKHETAAKRNDIGFVSSDFDNLMRELKDAVELVKTYLNGTVSVTTEPSSIEKSEELPAPEKGKPFLQKLFGRFSSSDKNQKETSSPQGAIPQSHKDKSILVVDDSDVIRTLIQTIFSETFQIITASDGGEALNIIGSLDELNIAGMLLDLDMPNIDGYFVLDILKEKDIFSKIPVCIITGNDTKESDDYVNRYPIIGILKKPFTEQDVKIIVEKFTSLSNQ